jgi:hypothetical protein
MVQSLGYITCTGSNVRATANQADPTARVGAQALLFQAHPDNAAPVYIGLSGMNTATGAQVLGVIPAPGDPTTGPYPSFSPSQPVLPAGLNAADFYVNGADGDFVIVSYAQG